MAPLIPFEPRLPCPVCVGATMEKVALRRKERVLILDHCTRCAGVWFDKGEPQHLAAHSPAELWALIPPRQHVLHPPCHGCGTPLDRDAHECRVCSRANELRCPVCDVKTARIQHNSLTLDVCAKCKGVWFDRTELRTIWSLELSALARGRRVTRGSAFVEGGEALMESLAWAPDLVVHGGPVIIEIVASAGESVFEVILSVIASVFEGL